MFRRLTCPIIFTFALLLGNAMEVYGSARPAAAIPELEGEALTDSRRLSVGECAQGLKLQVGPHHLVGWVGSEFVQFVRRGFKFFGLVHGKPAQLELLGNDMNGFRLQGNILGDEVNMPVHAGFSTGTLYHCPE